MNHENAICYCINKVEQNYGLFFRADPNIFYGEIPTGLLHWVKHRTRLTVSVVLTTGHLSWLEGPLSVWLLEPPHILPRVRNALYFRLL